LKKHIAAINAADLERFRRLGELGCIACRKTFGAFVQSEVCHVTHAGRRVSHQDTFPLCPYHHRGLLPDGVNGDQAAATLGPSFAKSKREFEETFGTEDDLVKEANRMMYGVDQ
jgi:hypothetical protein